MCYYEDQVEHMWVIWAPRHKKDPVLVRSVDTSVSTEVIKSVIREYEAYPYIDLAPVYWQKGKLGVRDYWSRLAIDITYYSSIYLMLFDYGPSWFVVCWEDSANVVCQLESIFHEQGPSIKILTDNDTTFMCKNFKKFLSNWGGHLWYQWSYAPAGNGIVERSQRSIKEPTSLDEIEPVIWTWKWFRRERVVSWLKINQTRKIWWLSQWWIVWRQNNFAR